MRTLSLGDEGVDVGVLQAATNRRARTRGLGTVEVDREVGPDTLRTVRAVARALGVEVGQADIIGKREQQVIRRPGLRTARELARARQWQRDRKKKQATAQRGPAAALREIRRYIGKTENPPGSNRGPWGLNEWIRHFLGMSSGVPWCGLTVGNALEKAGVAVTGRVAAVRYIYDDAGAGRYGFRRRVPIREGQPGDAVGLFGLSTHVGMIEKRVPGGFATVEGNTSSGNSGSQSNGGGCYRRIRPYSACVYVARPDWKD